MPIFWFIFWDDIISDEPTIIDAKTKLNEIFSSQKTLEDFIDEINKSLGDDHNFILELNC